MDWLFESPWTLIIAGVVVVLVLGLVLLNTGRAAVLIAMIAVAVVVVLGVLVERFVVTEREEVELALYGAAEALEANDVDAVTAYFAPEADHLRARAAELWPRFRVRSAHVGGLKVTVNHVTNPPSARTEFVGRIDFEDTRQQSPYETSPPRRFTIRWRRDGDRWLMVDYEEKAIGPGAEE